MDNALNTFLALLMMVFANLPSSSTKGSIQLVGSSQPTVALVGDDIILPCYLDPSMNASDRTVEWTKHGLEPRFVYVWRDGGELESKKNPSYKGRTSLFIHKLKHGDVSLNLLRVKLSDRGRFRCFVPDIGETLIELVVGVVSSPVIVSIQKAEAGVTLQCESAGWYPEPELLWLESEGNLLSAGPTETLRGPDDLSTVSSRVTVEKRHSNNITCRVQQKNINQSRETHIYISDDFFTAPPGSAVYVSFLIILALSVLCILAVTFICWMQKRKASRHRQDSERTSQMERERDKEEQLAGKEEMKTQKTLEKRRQANSTLVLLS